MIYTQLTRKDDRDIDSLLSAYRHPWIRQYVSIDEMHFWNYVTQTPGVFFYKVYKEVKLVGAVHCEIYDKVLTLAIVVFPEYQNSGIGTEILTDIQNGKLPFNWEKILVSVDEGNIASVKLFDRMGFTCTGREDELLEFTYAK